MHFDTTPQKSNKDMSSSKTKNSAKIEKQNRKRHEQCTIVELCNKHQPDRNPIDIITLNTDRIVLNIFLNIVIENEDIKPKWVCARHYFLKHIIHIHILLYSS